MVHLVEIYYLCQVFLLSYYTEINIYLLIFRSLLIYTSSKIEDNPIIKYINTDIYDMFPYLNMLCAIHMIENFNNLRFYFLVNFILYSQLNVFYKEYIAKQNICSIIYLTMCLMCDI